MAHCGICSDARARQINLKLLTGARIAATAKEFGYKFGSMMHHRRHCLPWRNARTKKPETTQEKMQDLEFHLSRLRALAEAGDRVSEALRVITAQRTLLELQMRAEHRLGATHSKLFPPSPPEGEFSVEFVNGKPRGRAQ